MKKINKRIIAGRILIFIPIVSGVGAFFIYLITQVGWLIVLSALGIAIVSLACIFTGLVLSDEI